MSAKDKILATVITLIVFGFFIFAGVLTRYHTEAAELIGSWVR